MQELLEGMIRENPAGFRKGRACADLSFILRRMIDEALEHQISLFINFVDFTKAFDSVVREALWGLLRHYGVPEKNVKMIKADLNVQ